MSQLEVGKMYRFKNGSNIIRIVKRFRTSEGTPYLRIQYVPNDIGTDITHAHNEAIIASIVHPVPFDGMYEPNLAFKMRR